MQGSYAATPFYWDFNDDTRAFAKRYQEKHPEEADAERHAGRHVFGDRASSEGLRTAEECDDGKGLVDAMKAMPTDDPLFGKGTIRVDGRHMHPVYLMTAKTAAESKGEWDIFKMVSTVKAEDAFRPLDKGGCAFVKG